MRDSTKISKFYKKVWCNGDNLFDPAIVEYHIYLFLQFHPVLDVMSLEGPLFCHLIKEVCRFLGDCSKCHHDEGKPVQLSALQEQRQFTLPFVMTGQGCITTLNTENIHFHFKSLNDFFPILHIKYALACRKG